MSDPRVSTNRPSTPTPASGPRSSGAPSESPGFDQAAAEFASLLGADDNARAEEPRRSETTDSAESTEGGRETDSPRGEHGRVGGKKEDRGDGKSGDGEQSGGDGEQPPAEVFAFGDLILQSLSRKDAPAAAAAEGPSLAPPLQMDNIVQQVADRILVSPPGAGGQEVRIMLKESVLPGTEIRISQQGGQLQIQFVTDSARSQELLTQHHAQLQKQLTEKLGEGEVVVQIEMESQGQPDRDGRSRNQRDIEAEMREANP